LALPSASWSAPAERRGDGAFARTGLELIDESPRPQESGVSRTLSGFPPQSKRAGSNPVKPNQTQSNQFCDKIAADPAQNTEPCGIVIGNRPRLGSSADLCPEMGQQSMPDQAQSNLIQPNPTNFWRN
jgi:hypothetical protein